MQNKVVRLLIMTGCLVGPAVVGATYSTEATMSLQKDEGELDVAVRVSRLVDRDGKSVEQLVAAPKIKTAPGVPATLSQRLQPDDPNYPLGESVTVDVSWPYPNESGTAFCAVTVKHGDEVVSKSRLQLKIEGPGRVPLVVAAPEVDPKSVRVVDQKSQIYVVLEFARKTPEQAKKMAIENYGNKVQVRDLGDPFTTDGFRKLTRMNGHARKRHA